MPKKTPINLALQGGGAHGAFTWGVLDRFLELDIFDIKAISATSAGSVNAIALTQGLMDGGTQGARQQLELFWHAMSEYSAQFALTLQTPLDYVMQPYVKAPFSFLMFSWMISAFSPYQFNPFNYNPLKIVLEKMIDIERIKRESPLQLFICATNVQTGKIRIFSEDSLSVNAVLASACLPKLFQAVEVDNEFYWDGGYLGNPAIFPLIYNSKANDILILHTVPIVRKHIPSSVMDTEARLREISFNSSLMREMRAVAFVSKLIDEHWIKDEYQHKLKRLYLHCIRADNALLAFPMASIYIPEWSFINQLKELGRTAADEWLKNNFAAIGKNDTVDFDEWL